MAEVAGEGDWAPASASWLTAEGGSIAFCSRACACKQDKNSRRIWFKSTKKHFYQFNPPPYRTDRTGQAKYIPSTLLTLQY